jgi:methionyl-tRNA synthetase
MEGHHDVAIKHLALNVDRINRTIYHCAETLRIVGILLQPYMPTKAAELLDYIGVDPSRRTYDDAIYKGDFTYGKPIKSMAKGAFGGLFPPLPLES